MLHLRQGNIRRACVYPDAQEDGSAYPCWLCADGKESVRNTEEKIARTVIMNVTVITVRLGYVNTGDRIWSTRGSERMNEELKPCPFCGGEAVVHVENGVKVICRDCGVSSKYLVDGYSQGRPYGISIETVIKMWNRRVADKVHDL